MVVDEEELGDAEGGILPLASVRRALPDRQTKAVA